MEIDGCWILKYLEAAQTRLAYRLLFLLFYLTHTQKHCILTTELPISTPRIGAITLIISNNTVYIQTLVYEHGQ